jgi:hypothetical protein
MQDLLYAVSGVLVVLLILLAIQERKCYLRRKEKHKRGEYLDLRRLQKDLTKNV